jgi:tetraacyldisaccharide 4'-kinase
VTRRFGRGTAGAVESSWSGAPGTVPWTLALGPAAALYEAAASRARRRAGATRRLVSGVDVIAVGNLTVGGTGKSSLARWIAARAGAHGRAALLLRGHGGSRSGEEPHAVPDFAGYPLARAAEAFGDEAAAHRAALSSCVAVVAGRDRWRAALLARDGYGARTAVLDDGWEQGTLAWNALWVVLDPEHPAGNGRELPAGPLRRPPRTLGDAHVLAFVLERADQEVPDAVVAWARRFAPIACAARFRRVLLGLARAGVPVSRPEPAAQALAGPALLLSAVGAPARLERFVQGAGIAIAAHAAFPDHARVDPARLRELMRAAARRGAAAAIVTEKDEYRWSLPPDPPIPVLALRTDLVPLDPVDRLPGIAPGPVRTNCGGEPIATPSGAAAATAT